MTPQGRAYLAERAQRELGRSFERDVVPGGPSHVGQEEGAPSTGPRRRVVGLLQRLVMPTGRASVAAPGKDKEDHDV